MLTTYLRFVTLPMNTPPVATMLHPWNRSIVFSSIISVVSRPSHSEEQRDGSHNHKTNSLVKISCSRTPLSPVGHGPSQGMHCPSLEK